jgi:hypothetical protein
MLLWLSGWYAEGLKHQIGNKSMTFGTQIQPIGGLMYRAGCRNETQWELS